MSRAELIALAEHLGEQVDIADEERRHAEEELDTAEAEVRRLRESVRYLERVIVPVSVPMGMRN